MVASTLFLLLIVYLISVHSYGFQTFKLKHVSHNKRPQQVKKNSLLNNNFNSILAIKGANEDSVFGSEFVNNKNKKKSFPKPGSNGRGGNDPMTDQEWEQLQQIKKQSKQCNNNNNSLQLEL